MPETKTTIITQKGQRKRCSHRKCPLH